MRWGSKRIVMISAFRPAIGSRAEHGSKRQRRRELLHATAGLRGPHPPCCSVTCLLVEVTARRESAASQAVAVSAASRVGNGACQHLATRFLSDAHTYGTVWGPCLLSPRAAAYAAFYRWCTQSVVSGAVAPGSRRPNVGRHFATRIASIRIRSDGYDTPRRLQARDQSVTN